MRKIMTGLLLFLCIYGQGHDPKALELMLPQIYADDIDIAGWLVSEKLDGVRGYWDGKKLLSKNGIPFEPPAEFLKNFPDFALEGEIWGGHATFEKTISIIKQQKADQGWLTLKFAVFDVPEVDDIFIRRIDKAIVWFSQHPSDHAFVIPQKIVRHKDDLKEELRKVEELGGEGLILRKADAFYHKGRSNEILKVKSYQDMEAKVIDHILGTGKNKDRLGSLLVELPDGTRCKIGTGFTDQQRETPPAIGTIITFKYYGFYQSGLPKFPSFLRVRENPGL